ncbi:MAG: thioesterase family protein [Coxiellaceae bacterium]|nr:thioesterase family protein [Coxiellaceae bacterium]
MEQFEIPTRWVDVDSYGHVNNAKYFDYMTEIRALALLGLESDPNIQFVIAETSCRFKQPITYPCNIIMQQTTSRIGDTNFELKYNILTDKDPNCINATGIARMACYHMKKKRTCQIPDSIREYLQQHLEGNE